jgi:hypothetical protein
MELSVSKQFDRIRAASAREPVFTMGGREWREVKKSDRR